MTPQDFEALCKTHDWSYDYSDDHRKWQAGNAVEEKIINAVRNGGLEIRAIYLKYCFLPWRESEVVDAYNKVRATADQRIGVKSRKEWEARTKIDALYTTLPRFKQGWWWLCELSRFLERETEEKSIVLDTCGYKHPL